MMLLDKIIELRDRFRKGHADPQDISSIDSWYEEAKRLFLLKSLKEHDGVKYLINIFGSEVGKINELINKSYSKDLKDTERDRLLDRRDLAQKYLDLFVHVEDDIDRLEELVDKEIN